MFTGTSSKSIYGYDPRNVPGCQLWLDGADPNVLFSDTAGTTPATFGDRVKLWKDKSGLGLDFSNAETVGIYPNYSSPGTPPVYVENDGLPYLDFESHAYSSLYNSSSVLFNTSAWDFYVVVRCQNPNGIYEVNWMTLSYPILTEFPSENNMWSTFVSDLNFPALWFNNTTVLNSATGFSSKSKLQIYQLYSTGSSVGRRINGQSAGAGDDQSTSYSYATRSGTHTIGINNNPAGLWLWQGMQIQEILVFSNCLTDTHRQQIEGYLGWKWNIPLSTVYTEVRYTPTGADQYWTCPTGITEVDIAMQGAGGSYGYVGGGNGPESMGGWVSGTWTTSAGVPLIPGNTYTVVVGTEVGGVNTGNYGGGGAGVGDAGGGGGRVAILDSSGNDIITAGAGGGAAYYVSGSPGGGLTGMPGWGTTGGSQTAGGYYGGAYQTGGSATAYGGAGGGGGYYGGGGGTYYQSSGAGGSSYVSNLSGYVVNDNGGGTWSTVGGRLTFFIPRTSYAHPYAAVPPMGRYFNPVDIPNCVMWFDGMDPKTMYSDTGGTTLITLSTCNVKHWKSKAGYGTFATNYYGNSWDSNGNGIVFANGMDISHQWVDPNTPIPSFDIFFVGSLSSLSGPSAFYIWDSYLDSNKMVCTNGTGELYDSTYTPTLYFPTNTSTIVYDSRGQSAAALRLFGSNESTGYLQTGGYYLPVRIGSYVGNANEWGGPINEFIVFSSNLTIGERQQVEGYLKWKWNTSIISGHPFSNFPPSSPHYFNPLSVTNCEIWLDAAGLTTSNFTFSSGSNISTWLDKSGKGHNFSTSSNPVFSNSGVVTTYSASKYCYNIDTSLNLPTITSFIVFTQTGNTQGELITTNQGYGFSPYYNTDTYYQVENNTSNGGGGSIFPLNTLHLATLRYYSNVNGGAIKIYKNGSNVINDTQTGIIYWSDGIAIPFAFDGTVNEALVYNRVLTDQEVQKIEGYLAYKWKI